MTEQTTALEADAPDASLEREIDVEGRKIWVRMPTPEQLLVWKRTLGKLQLLSDQDFSKWDGEQVLGALDRARKLVDSLLVHEADQDWLDDQLLAKNLGMMEVASIIQKATEAFQTPNNREERRAAERTAKKAARKKATR